MIRLRAEFIIEPFVEGRPGDHVGAGVSAFTDAELAVDVGPFSSSSEGDLPAIVDAVRAMLAAAFEAGATTVQLHVTRPE